MHQIRKRLPSRRQASGPDASSVHWSCCSCSSTCRQIDENRSSPRGIHPARILTSLAVPSEPSCSSARSSTRFRYLDPRPILLAAYLGARLLPTCAPANLSTSNHFWRAGLGWPLLARTTPRALVHCAVRRRLVSAMNAAAALP